MKKREDAMTISPDRVWARTLTIATVAAASLALSGCSLLGNITGGNTPEPSTNGSNTDVFAIDVGDCLLDADLEGTITEVPTIDCASPHDSEAYASIIMDDGDFPGEEAVDAQAVADCTTEFNFFVGVDYQESELDFAYYYPTEESWAQGDREILCLIVDPSGQVTGSLRHANR
jgi:putative regulator of septum formation